MSGGSDVCSAFVGGNPTWPVHAGEIQCRALGCNLQAFDEEGRACSGGSWRNGDLKSHAFHADLFLE